MHRNQCFDWSQVASDLSGNVLAVAYKTLRDALRRFVMEFFSKRLPEVYEKLQDGSDALPRPSNAARMEPPSRLKTVLDTSKTLISLQTSFKNEFWQRLQRRLRFKGVARCF